MNGNMTIEPWDIWWASVEYEDRPGVEKIRPVLVIKDKIVYVLAYKMTTHEPRPMWGEYAIDWAAAGLQKPTTLRMNKPLKLNKDKLKSKIGTLPYADRMTVIQMVKNRNI